MGAIPNLLFSLQLKKKEETELCPQPPGYAVIAGRKDIFCSRIDMGLSEFPWGEPYYAVKGAVEISNIIKADVYRDIGDSVFCFNQTDLCLSYAQIIHILHRRIPETLFK